MTYRSNSGLEFGAPVVGGIKVHGAIERELKFKPDTQIAGDTLVGIACRFGVLHKNRDDYELFQQGCFARSLAGKQAVRLLIDHDESKLVTTSADALKIESDDKEVRISCAVPDSPLGRLLSKAVKSDGRIEMSVGFSAICDRRVTLNDGKSVRVITDADLYEISVVTCGAVPGTKAEIRSKSEDSLMKSLQRLEDIYIERARQRRLIADRL
ncbi:HK97 family phage prohead protease [Rhizobium leguminosarum]|uniref:HK97 family phage prohead protease n=1 Tax=Rhizobium leguminosarum TaxID=384 RepID=UPI003F9449D1